MSDEGRFEDVDPISECIARRMGVGPERYIAPSEREEHRRAMNRMIELRHRYPWLKAMPAFVEAAVLWSSFAIEKVKRTLAGWIRQSDGGEDDGER